MFNAVINAFLTEVSSANKTLICFNIKSALKKENILFLIIGVFLALVAMIFNYYLEFKFLYILFYPFVCIYIFFCCLYAFVDLNSLKKNNKSFLKTKIKLSTRFFYAIFAFLLLFVFDILFKYDYIYFILLFFLCFFFFIILKVNSIDFFIFTITISTIICFILLDFTYIYICFCLSILLVFLYDKTLDILIKQDKILKTLVNAIQVLLCSFYMSFCFVVFYYFTPIGLFNKLYSKEDLSGVLPNVGFFNDIIAIYDYIFYLLLFCFPICILLSFKVVNFYRIYEFFKVLFYCFAFLPVLIQVEIMFANFVFNIQLFSYTENNCLETLSQTITMLISILLSINYSLKDKKGDIK